MTSAHGNVQTPHTRRGQISNTTSEKLTLNSKKQEASSMKLDSITPTPLLIRRWRASKPMRTNVWTQTHNTLPHSHQPIKPTPLWSRRCRLFSSRSNPYNSLILQTMEATMAAAAATDADTVPVGAVDAPNRRPCTPRSTAGPTATAIMVAKNAHILPVEIRRKHLSPT